MCYGLRSAGRATGSTTTFLPIWSARSPGIGHGTRRGLGHQIGRGWSCNPEVLCHWIPSTVNPVEEGRSCGKFEQKSPIDDTGITFGLRSQLNTNQGRFVLTSTGDLQIVQLHRTDSGTYVCIADNGVGEPVFREVKLQVNGKFHTPLRLWMNGC